MAITDAVKLAIYNGALTEYIGDRRLSALTDMSENRYVLDEIWGDNAELVLFALERAGWNFAMRIAEVDYDNGNDPEFGFRRNFVKPTDLRRLESLAGDPDFSLPLNGDQYVDMAGYWSANYDKIYVKYVSDDASYGLSDTNWTQGFTDYLKAEMAARGCFRITSDKALTEAVMKMRDGALKRAKSTDAMAEGVKFPPQGTWARSRYGGAIRRERSRLG